jgi:hypothetical protein
MVKIRLALEKSHVYGENITYAVHELLHMRWHSPEENIERSHHGNYHSQSQNIRTRTKSGFGIPCFKSVLNAVLITIEQYILELTPIMDGWLRNIGYMIHGRYK